ncbi:MAG: hypothetical protein R3323_09770, partial [Wenzhouxiangellaceae bacterium]|nr:hypothetical protein [Wenzhouxiangellaceae bacterium]
MVSERRLRNEAALVPRNIYDPAASKPQWLLLVAECEPNPINSNPFKSSEPGESRMKARILKAALVAVLALPAAAGAQSVQLMIDEQPLSDFDVADFAAQAGLESIAFFPFQSRLSLQTHFADLTCEFRDSTGTIVAPPFDPGSATLEIDRIPTPVGEPDPNVDYLGNPIPRSYPIDPTPASGTISQMMLSGQTVLDVCTSDSGC